MIPSPLHFPFNKSVLPFLMDFTKRDFCSVFVFVNSHCCCCSQKDCVNEVGKNFHYIPKVCCDINVWKVSVKVLGLLVQNAFQTSSAV